MQQETFVDGISFWAQRLPGWEIAGAVLAGRADPPVVAGRRPSPELLPPAERRRAPDSVALAMEVAAGACAAAAVDPAGLASVFATTHADLAITDYLCETLVRAPLHTSPTRFHNSVHNAAAGYWCIATGCHAPYTTLSVHEYSFAAGLFETLLQVASDGRPVLYVAFDIEACGPLAPITVSHGLLGAGLVLSPVRTATSRARLSWSTRPGGGAQSTAARSANTELIGGNAMAACLPFYEALAAGGGPVTLALGPDLLLDVVLDSCAPAPP
ncbi:MAG: beta-ketoacyl synthase chain length factor [Steroidobacteraceae bacterium]